MVSLQMWEAFVWEPIHPCPSCTHTQCLNHGDTARGGCSHRSHTEFKATLNVPGGHPTGGIETLHTITQLMEMFSAVLCFHTSAH